jgi:hypothetical protein
MDVKSDLSNKILYINYNQDYSCFCSGTEDGYIICNVDKYKRIFHRSN